MELAAFKGTGFSGLSDHSSTSEIEMEQVVAPPQTLVINFNSPELNYLALALAQNKSLLRYVRPYVNKGRLWERTLAALPLAGSLYTGTFGRRRINDERLVRLTQEAGVFSDIFAAVIGRAKVIPNQYRRLWANELYGAVRKAVAEQGREHTREAACVVAYEGFALPAFQSIKSGRAGKAILNYPIAHHRQQRKTRLEENEREPAFASTWPDFQGWAEGHEEKLNQEIELADGILVGSSFSRDSFIAEGVAANKLKVISYGVDLDIFTPPEDSNVKQSPQRFNIIFAGQLTQRKGISYLLRGYQKFKRGNSQLNLVGGFLGDMEAFRPYAELFRHVPHLTRPALAQMYRESDVFVFPTLFEGMGLVVLEAMACGLPVIVTANGPGDIVRDGIDGFVIPARDEDAICDRLDRLYRDRDLRIAMGRNAQARAREFTWNAYTTQVQNYLAEVVQQS